MVDLLLVCIVFLAFGVFRDSSHLPGCGCPNGCGDVGAQSLNSVIWTHKSLKRGRARGTVRTVTDRSGFPHYRGDSLQSVRWHVAALCPARHK